MFNEPIFSVKDVAYLLGIPKLLVYKLINVGKLKAYMDNRKEGYKITKKDFKEYCDTRKVNFDEILEKYYTTKDIKIDKEKVSPQDNNSILGYPPHPYNTAYKGPNMYYDPTYSPENRESTSACDKKRPEYFKNDHNALYTSNEIGRRFNINPFSFYMLLEKLGYFYIVDGKWYAVAPLIRFGLVKYDFQSKLPVWTYIGKNFLEDQLLYEIGLSYVNPEKNQELIDTILSAYR